MKTLIFILFSILSLAFRAYSQAINYDQLEHINGQFCTKDKKPFTGSCVAYHPNGKKSYEGSFKNGYVFGGFKWYYDNGQPLRQITYSLDTTTYTCEIDGKATRWFSNGKVKEVVNYKFGQYHGEWYELDKTGKKIKKGVYKNNKLISGDKYIPPEEV